MGKTVSKLASATSAGPRHEDVEQVTPTGSTGYKGGPSVHGRDWSIRVGFVPLNDCAPLVVAQALGYFKKYDLRVQLHRELGWATVRDKIAHGELDAAHAVCGLPFILRAGVRNRPCDCVTPMVLSLNGNAVTLSEALWNQGVRDARTLGQIARSNAGDRRFIFGVVSRHSAHAHLMQAWLKGAGLVPDVDVDIVVVPPPQMVANLQAGHIDGFCAGEPYNSQAVARGTGWVAGTSLDLAPRHPEKVLVSRTALIKERGDEHLALMAALLEACAYCDDPANHDTISELLAGRPYLNMSVDVIRRGWPGRFDCGHGRRISAPDFNVFHRDNANEPSADKAAWVVRNLLSEELRPAFPPVSLGKVFRADLHAAAQELRERTVPA